MASLLQTARRRPLATRAIASAVVLAVLGALVAIAQPSVPRATTVSSLLFHSSFFHDQRVTLRGRLRVETGGTWLDNGDDMVRIVGDVASTGTAEADGTIEVRATFWDVGRLQPDDPRVAPYDLTGALPDLQDRDWPRPGEVLVLANATGVPFTRPPQPTLRSLALEPDRYDGTSVMVVGRYRARNLYGDLPQAPRQSRWDFVLQSGDSAIWVTGKQPKGRGFELGLTARVDTGRWLEVSGILRRGGGLVWIEASDLNIADAPLVEPKTAPPTPSAAVTGPPPEVVFSTPVQDDVDHAPDAPVRIQFSEDMAPDSFVGRVRASYVGTDESLAIDVAYRPGNRVLQIRFAEPLEPFRSVHVDLGDGIQSLDGLALRPWTLTFSVGP